MRSAEVIYKFLIRTCCMLLYLMWMSFSQKNKMESDWCFLRLISLFLGQTLLYQFAQGMTTLNNYFFWNLPEFRLHAGLHREACSVGVFDLESSSDNMRETKDLVLKSEILKTINFSVGCSISLFSGTLKWKSVFMSVYLGIVFLNE